MCIGSPKPRERRIFSRTSGGTVIGRLPVGSPGARSSIAKITKLITRSVGIAAKRRRIMKPIKLGRKINSQRAHNQFNTACTIGDHRLKSFLPQQWTPVRVIEKTVFFCLFLQGALKTGATQGPGVGGWDTIRIHTPCVTSGEKKVPTARGGRGLRARLASKESFRPHLPVVLSKSGSTTAVTGSPALCL